MGSPGAALSTGAGLANIFQGLASGTATGKVQAGIGSAQLANKGGAFGTQSANASNVLGAAGGALGLYNGIQQGGIGGDLAAGAGAAKVGQAGLNLYGSATGSTAASGAAGALGTAAGVLGAGYSLYNFGKNWQSGATGSDALSGAEAGASVGSIVPGIGTAIGAVIGGAVGALSSIAGGGKPDIETGNFNQYTQQYNLNSSVASQLSPSQNFQNLAGIFDGKSTAAGSSTPLEQAFGKGGETAFTTGMMDQVNQAVQSGKLPANATPQQIYNQVVNPWLANQNGTNASIQSNWTNTQGEQFGDALQSSVINLIGQWQSGQLSANTPLDSGGQTLTGYVPYAGGKQAFTGYTPQANNFTQNTSGSMASLGLYNG